MHNGLLPRSVFRRIWTFLINFIYLVQQLNVMLETVTIRFSPLSLFTMTSSPTNKSRLGTVTIHEVAAFAGISLVTLSRAPNDPKQLSANILAKVITAIEKTGYVLNLSAGNLRSSTSRLIATFVPTLQGTLPAWSRR